MGLHWTKDLIEQGWDPTNLEYVGEQEPLRVADSVYFASHESLALQLVDVCCWTIARQLLETLYEWKQPVLAPFYAIIQRRVMNDGTPPLYRGWGSDKEGWLTLGLWSGHNSRHHAFERTFKFADVCIA